MLKIMHSNYSSGNVEINSTKKLHKKLIKDLDLDLELVNQSSKAIDFCFVLINGFF